MTALFALFLAAFAAATILPMQSEAALAALIVAGDHPLPLLITVAGTGNTLGAVVNWWLGGRLEMFSNRSWFPASPLQLERAQAWYQRWGKYLLLLSWLPFGGDALTVAAGLMRERLLPFLALVAIGKFGRYIALALLVKGAL